MLKMMYVYVGFTIISFEIRSKRFLTTHLHVCFSKLPSRLSFSLAAAAAGFFVCCCCNCFNPSLLSYYVYLCPSFFKSHASPLVKGRLASGSKYYSCMASLLNCFRHFGPFSSLRLKSVRVITWQTTCMKNGLELYNQITYCDHGATQLDLDLLASRDRFNVCASSHSCPRLPLPAAEVQKVRQD